METQIKTQVLIAGVSQNQANFDYSMTELSELATANDMIVVGEIRQNAPRTTAATYFGSGKVLEVAQRAKELDATVILVNDELSPSQIRNLENEMKLRVMDRTELILNIFANRAKSKQAITQVEIARLQYQLPRIHPSANRLDQQGGGGAGGLANRGAGETQLELDRRVIRKRISHLREVLKDSAKDQEVQRASRDKNATPVVALVGYTNAGKSTTMNGLLAQYSPAVDKSEKQVFEKDMLFATLDTSVREIVLPNKKKFLLSDTVGFVSKLPHHLIDAFKATLAEAANADLLIQVVDFSDPNYPEMMKITSETLASIGVHDIPMIVGYNKADLKPETQYPEINGDEIVYSARDPRSLNKLVEMIQRHVFADDVTAKFFFTFAQGRALNLMQQKGHVLSENYTDKGTEIIAEVNPTLRQKLAANFVEEIPAQV